MKKIIYYYKEYSNLKTALTYIRKAFSEKGKDDNEEYYQIKINIFEDGRFQAGRRREKRG